MFRVAGRVDGDNGNLWLLDVLCRYSQGGDGLLETGTGGLHCPATLVGIFCDAVAVWKRVKRGRGRASLLQLLAS